VPRALAKAQEREHGDRGQHEKGEQVLEEAEHSRVTDAGDGEVMGEQSAVGLNDGEQEDDESPEGQGVR
jgi:hypothetical protein